jgi:hypothetical protein
MKTLAFIFALLISFSASHACVTYNPGTQTYVIDTYGSWELGSEGYSQEYDRKKIKPKSESGSSWDRCAGKPKIVKQPRPKDWVESEHG